MRRLFLRARAILARRRLEQDMQDEMRMHVDRATERFIERGMSPADARAAARKEFGNATVIQEDARDARGARWISAIGGDLRFAMRHFGRQPLTTATIIVVLALGIGANSGIFTVLQAVTTRPAAAVPKDPSHVRIYGLEQKQRGAKPELRDFTLAEVNELAARRETFRAVAAWVEDDVMLAGPDSTGVRDAIVEFVSPNYFTTLGVAPAVGVVPVSREPSDEQPDALISFAQAQDLFGSPESAVGKRILVDEVPVRVVGVTPPLFQGAILHNDRPSVWMPMGARSVVKRLHPRWLADSAHLSVFARLAPGVTQQQATTIARAVAARMVPDSASRLGATFSAEIRPLHSNPPTRENESEDVIMLIMTSVMGLLILLVACTNVSALLVSSAVARRHEIAVRISLGATRARILRQLLTESSLLAVAGGALGLLGYWGFTRIVESTVPMTVSPDLATAAFTLAFALGTGLVFGLSPALHATRAGAAVALRESGAGATSRSRLQRTLVVAQIVFSQPLLLFLAVVLSLTLKNQATMSTSVREHVLSVQFLQSTRQRGGKDVERRAFVDAVRQRLQETPGVDAVVPERSYFATRMVGGGARGDRQRVNMVGAAPGYFNIVGVPIVLGRDVSYTDTVVTPGAAWNVVIGSDVARAVWGDANPIGKTLASSEGYTYDAGNVRDTVTMQVVGVFDASHPAMRGSELKVVTAHGQQWHPRKLMIRTHGSAAAFVPVLQKTLRADFPGAANRIETMAMYDDDQRKEMLMAAGLSGGGAALGLLLASLGLYGVVALSVRQRQREIGIRIALGAMPQRVARMFLANGVRLGAVALAIGLPVSMAALKLGISQGIVLAPAAEVWWGGVAIVVVTLLVASLSAWLPARTVTRVDPSRTLRSE
jgi:predicted permease